MESWQTVMLRVHDLVSMAWRVLLWVLQVFKLFEMLVGLLV